MRAAAALVVLVYASVCDAGIRKHGGLGRGGSVLIASSTERGSTCGFDISAALIAATNVKEKSVIGIGGLANVLLSELQLEGKKSEVVYKKPKMSQSSSHAKSLAMRELVFGLAACSKLVYCPSEMPLVEYIGGVESDANAVGILQSPVLVRLSGADGPEPFACDGKCLLYDENKARRAWRAYASGVSPQLAALALPQQPAVELVYDAAALMRLQRLDLDAALVATQQQLLGLAILESRKLRHRDMKPENFMIAVSDEIATVKLVDFGFACAFAAPSTGASPAALKGAGVLEPKCNFGDDASKMDVAVAGCLRGAQTAPGSEHYQSVSVYGVMQIKDDVAAQACMLNRDPAGLAALKRADAAQATEGVTSTYDTVAVGMMLVNLITGAQQTVGIASPTADSDAEGESESSVRLHSGGPAMLARFLALGDPSCAALRAGVGDVRASSALVARTRVRTHTLLAQYRIRKADYSTMPVSAFEHGSAPLDAVAGLFDNLVDGRTTKLMAPLSKFPCSKTAKKAKIITPCTDTGKRDKYGDDGDSRNTDWTPALMSYYVKPTDDKHPIHFSLYAELADDLEARPLKSRSRELGAQALRDLDAQVDSDRLEYAGSYAVHPAAAALLDLVASLLVPGLRPGVAAADMSLMSLVTSIDELRDLLYSEWDSTAAESPLTKLRAYHAAVSACVSAPPVDIIPKDRSLAPPEISALCRHKSRSAFATDVDRAKLRNAPPAAHSRNLWRGAREDSENTLSESASLTRALARQMKQSMAGITWTGANAPISTASAVCMSDVEYVMRTVIFDVGREAPTHARCANDASVTLVVHRSEGEHVGTDSKHVTHTSLGGDSDLRLTWYRTAAPGAAAELLKSRSLLRVGDEFLPGIGTPGAAARIPVKLAAQAVTCQNLKNKHGGNVANNPLSPRLRDMCGPGTKEEECFCLVLRSNNGQVKIARLFAKTGGADDSAAKAKLADFIKAVNKAASTPRA